MSEPLRAGTVALAGRPNSGKSTLLNRLLGEKVAIVSEKPQTTRNRLVGIHSEPRGQIVLFDTPGIHKPMHRMNRRMVQEAEAALEAVDVVCLLVDASQPFGGGDRFLLERMRHVRSPVFLLLNKIDLVRKDRLLPLIERYSQAAELAEIVPLSALTGDGVDLLVELLFARLPEGEPLYDPELLTLHPERFLAAEWIREKVLAATEEELPFSTAVSIDQWEEGEELVKIWASILVEKPGQKGILIGKQGRKIKEIGTAARLDLEELLERRVYLDLHVRVEERWREKPRILAQLEREVYGSR